MNTKALYNLSYGLFVLTTQEGGFDNGCIINTVMQVTSDPLRISITVNKANKTHDMILSSSVFNVSTLTEKTSFDMFKHFGFQSGANVNKFADFADADRSANGLYFIKSANSYLSCHVQKTIDLGTHTMFIADVTDAEVLSDVPSATYTYYQKNIKQKPEAKPTEGKVTWVCQICGYVYEGEVLPADFICPICKHGASDFERVVG